MATNDSDVTVASVALTMIGANAISSFSDGTTEAEVVEAVYEDLARGWLTMTRWRFATTQKDLVHLADEPAARWTDAWQIPVDCINLHTVTCNDNPIEYDRYRDKIYCDYDENNTLTADYTWRIPESEWLPSFKIAFQTNLAGILAPALRADTELAKKLIDNGEILMRKAQSIDSQQQTTRKFRTNRFTGQRLS